MLDMELAVVPICKGGTKSFRYDVVYLLTPVSIFHVLLQVGVRFRVTREDVPALVEDSLLKYAKNAFY